MSTPKEIEIKLELSPATLPRLKKIPLMQAPKATGKSGLFERDEWESGIAGAQPDLDLARGTALEALAGRKFRRRLKPMFETRVARTVYPLSSGTGEIEFT